ncbi:helix-hairpin-helix domain-containing protein [Croceivirga thetidis]|uniref:DUF4332 domain-containing protein n=1 Tax=Croceivirga thetidis TaxID=2721623 RepID=A0ABX1GNK9_9FLAO|nr:helix-hairpin-helix domain-containing protein [Croceivirga thetidis]NKI31508.1 hypothetical protein [Croceivirga thetidis]
MATATKNRTKKSESLNKSLINVTMATINTTIEHGEKWQELTKKMVKKTEPLRKRQMDLVFETAATVKNQFNTGKEKTMDLVGYDEDTIERAFEYVSKTPVGKKVLEVSETIKEKVIENPIVQKVEKTAENLKNQGVAKFNEVKEDALKQAKKVIDKGEDLVDDALKQTKKNVGKTKKTVTAKATKTSKKASVKVAEVKQKAAKVESTVKAVIKDDLKAIKGVGPKLERIFKENGIETFAQLAQATETKIKSILDEAGSTFKNTSVTDLKKQAELGAEAGVEAIAAWLADNKK